MLDDQKCVFIDRLLYPVTSLGPGKRIAIWLSGCNRHCYKCANPELWERKNSQKMDISNLAFMVDKLCKIKKVDGLTISGGEPMDQAIALNELLLCLKRMGHSLQDVLVFTGYTYDEVVGNQDRSKLLNSISVLIDGEYVDDLNDGVSALTGSSNQNIIYLNQNVRDRYKVYLEKGRMIENFVYDYNILSVGIHKG